VLDKYWKPDLSLEEGMEVMNKVIEQLKMRLVFKQDKFVIKVLTKDGIKVSYHETKK
jgi:20S proteasome subunit beta 4